MLDWTARLLIIMTRALLSAGYPENNKDKDWGFNGNLLFFFFILLYSDVKKIGSVLMHLILQPVPCGRTLGIV